MFNYSTAFSHLLLAGTGIYCLSGHGTKNLGFPQGCFGVIVLNSIIGVWRYGNPSYGDDADPAYKFTLEVQDLFALPCLVTTVTLGYGYMWEIAYAHTLVSLIPLVMYFSDKDNKDLKNAIIGVNCVSLAVVSFLEQNYFGCAAAASYAFANYIIRGENETYFDIPTQDLFNYSLCFFSFFALRAMSD